MYASTAIGRPETVAGSWIRITRCCVQLVTRLVPSQSTVRWWLHLRPKRRRDLCWFEFEYSCTWRSTRCSRTVAALHVNAGRWIHFTDYAPRLVNRVANRRMWNFTRIWISYIVFPLFDPFFNVIFFTDFETFCACLLCSPLYGLCVTRTSAAPFIRLIRFRLCEPLRVGTWHQLTCRL